MKKLLVDENFINATDSEKINLYFALGKAFEDVNDIESSYKILNEANKLKNKSTNFNFSKTEKLFNNVIKLFENIDENLIKKKQNLKQIIFICGMPRSGTTLVEQIIASHSKVNGAGEIHYLSNIINDFFLRDQKLTASVSLKLQSKLNKNLIIIDWKKRNSSFMNALAVEKNVMFVILTLIILVAAFNIISSMIMLVQTKKADIALMRTMGASQYLIIKVFMLTGSIIGFLGTFVGVLLGVFISMNIEKIRQLITSMFGQELFSAEIYFLSKLPSNININEVLIVICISIFLTLLASIFPAWKASKISPAEALRYE